MKKIASIFTWYLLAVASFALCTFSQTFAETNTLSGTSWELSEYNGEAASSGTLSFDDEKAYSKFCNNVSQGYTYDGKTIISDGKGISTMMYCEGLPMTLENNFKLDTAASITISGEMLTLETSAGNTYTFQKSEPIMIVGNDRDEHGCIGSAGYSWDTDLDECARPWELEGVKSAFNFSVEYKLTSKNTLKTFKRDNTISRQEAAIMLVLLAKNGYSQDVVIAIACDTYRDDKTIGEGFKQSVYDACARGLMVGANGEFMPSGSLTRGQALSILVKMVDGQAQNPTTPFWDAYVARAKAIDLLTLEGPQDFEAAITRGEFITWMHSIYESHARNIAMKDAQKSLDATKLLWSKNGPETYTFTQTISCFCAPDYTKPRTYTVTNGSVVKDTHNDDEFMPELLTVEGAFAVIQDALDKNAARITVEYDTTLGYPKVVSIDYSEMIADEEKYYTFSLTK